MTETTVGREPVQIVEIQQPLCENVFGAAPCTATGTNDTKCYNTRATCQDSANFALGDPLKLYFSAGQIFRHYNGAAVSLPPNIIPSLVSVSTSPTRINLAGANPDAQGLGNRALCTISIQDHQHSDRVVDPYVDGRSWNPLDASRGSFWTRWLVRNKYRQNVVVKVYEGYVGQTLAQMVVRQYFLQSIEGPDDSGRITIQAKDILAKLEERKAQAPAASAGELYADIDNSQTSFTVANAVLADYPSSGTVRIDDELITYTSTSTVANGIQLAGCTRGADNSTARAHSAKDAVQECVRYTEARLDDVLEDLLTTYGEIPSAYIDSAGFTAEVDNYATAYRLTTIITEPTAVSELISQIQIQALCYVWWDERDSLIKMKIIRGIDEEPDTVTDESNIIAGSFSLMEKPRERASQVWIYYGRTDYSKAINSAASYPNLTIIADLESETDVQYGEASIRKIFGNWLRSSALANTTATKIINRYRDIPSQATFELDAKDRDYWIGDVFKISHHLDVNQYGERRIRNWTVVSAEEIIPGDRVRYLVEDTTLYGRIHFVMADAAADYPGYDVAPFKNCYVGDADGLLSDGEPSGRIS